MALTAAHWLYAAVTLVVILTMLFKRGVVLPTLIGTLLVAWVFKGSFVAGLQSIFNANLVAAKELFSIFLIITFMVALLRSLKDLGADQRMIKPIQRMMVNGHVSFFILAGMTYTISLFFWPTPAVPLIGALLLPPAIRAGLPAMAGAVAIAIAGQGMALSSDYVMQVAPMLSAKAAGVSTGQVADKAMILSLITGGVAIGIAYLSNAYRKVRKADDRLIDQEIGYLGGSQAETEVAVTLEKVDSDRFQSRQQLQKWGKCFAVLVPLSLLAVIIIMVQSKYGGQESGLEGPGGAAFIGGVAAVLLAMATFSYARLHALDRISEHIVEGFVFAFKAMGPVVPIAGFFFLGSGDFAGEILSQDKNAPSFLFDLVQAGQALIPVNSLLTGFGVLIIGMITGLDGSGFSGLPLTGGLSGALANASGVDPGTLAAIGQMGSIWTGGGTIIAWSSLVAVAGFAGVPVIELVRRNFVPVVIGLFVSTLVALLIW
ncbi:H+/gluconate symporter-like permease [Melghirimyces profundicolus]|uniref:H+/gluconate symporter-like permease n=1 Tax=Melghirimyces profundicolus TaxID=1242148 RepID=A0A2T6C8M0_9BACL|nr:hypothetical protein [Melghirimyces profundicolus]PTX64668.1 H+/gluconate symporter-like permease [Melghirimyces profundicolus]